MTRNETRDGWPFNQPLPDGAAPPAVSTAQGLVWFRDELDAAGFPPDQVAALVATACEAEVRVNGLAVTPPGTQQ